MYGIYLSQKENAIKNEVNRKVKRDLLSCI